MVFVVTVGNSDGRSPTSKWDAFGNMDLSDRVKVERRERSEANHGWCWC